MVYLFKDLFGRLLFVSFRYSICFSLVSSLTSVRYRMVSFTEPVFTLAYRELGLLSVIKESSFFDFSFQPFRWFSSSPFLISSFICRFTTWYDGSLVLFDSKTCLADLFVIMLLGK